jgi:parallel beta-helix repeat protein
LREIAGGLILMSGNGLNMKYIFAASWLGLIFFFARVEAATFTVTSTANSGSGTLRQAILDANANPGADTIVFNIPGSGVQTIAPTNALPAITNAVFIDGFSQAGSSANSVVGSDNSVHLIRLDGYQCLDPSAAGLNFTTANPFAASPASGSTVRGLCIVRFNNGISASECANLTISGNWLGLDVDGVSRGNRGCGIYLISFFAPGVSNTLGGTTPAARNLISGNGNRGVYFSGSTTASNFVQGNFIGTDQTGTLPRGNAFGGIYLFSSANNTIGGTTAAARNLISASTAAGGSGITVQGGPNNNIQGNYIGADASGQSDLGNLYDGVYIASANGSRILGNLIVNNRANGINLSSANGTVVENNFIGTDSTGTRPFGNLAAGITISGSANRIGGLGAGQANTIFFNGGPGVEVTSASGLQNEISGNAIYDNGGLGIDLYPADISTNDVLDVDTGANELQNFPALTSVNSAFSALSVSGTLNTKAGAAYRLEFFATPTWDATNIAEGKIFLGSTNLTTDGSGHAAFTAAINATPDTNYLITATATDPAGNTSEFSAGTSIIMAGAANPSLIMSASPPSGGGGSGAATLNVAWPSAATFFDLEKTASLQPPVHWQAITSGILDSGGVKSVIITNRSATNEFFRLRKP